MRFGKQLQEHPLLHSTVIGGAQHFLGILSIHGFMLVGKNALRIVTCCASSQIRGGLLQVEFGMRAQQSNADNAPVSRFLSSGPSVSHSL